MYVVKKRKRSRACAFLSAPFQCVPAPYTPPSNLFDFWRWRCLSFFPTSVNNRNIITSGATPFIFTLEFLCGQKCFIKKKEEKRQILAFSGIAAAITVQDQDADNLQLSNQPRAASAERCTHFLHAHSHRIQSKSLSLQNIPDPALSTSTTHTHTRTHATFPALSDNQHPPHLHSRIACPPPSRSAGTLHRRVAASRDSCNA